MPGFELFVDDNYHYMDEESRYKIGWFESYEEALARAKEIVDEFLESAHQPGMNSKELYKIYVGFGEDPFIVPAGEPHFSGWDYARQRCAEICRDEDAVALVWRYPTWPPELSGFVTVLQEALGRQDLKAVDRRELEVWHRAIEAYPNAMPDEGEWYWLRLEKGDAAFTIYLYENRFLLYVDGILPGKVELELRFRGSGRLDHREGDIVAAFEAMRQAMLDPTFILRIKD
jgi:hypothetical protein